MACQRTTTRTPFAGALLNVGTWSRDVSQYEPLLRGSTGTVGKLPKRLVSAIHSARTAMHPRGSPQGNQQGRRHVEVEIPNLVFNKVQHQEDDHRHEECRTEC